MNHPDTFTQRGGVLLACLAIVTLSLVYSCARAGGTVTDSKYYLLQRSGVTQSPNPASMTECLARMLERIEQELKSRTTGYVTYKCLDISQSYVKFSKTTVPPPPVVEPPPVAQLQVYACADAGADGRILESDTVRWPNCSSVSYQPPSRALVVAVNPGTRPFYWRLASKVVDDRLWTQTGGVGAWVRAGSIDWGTPTLGSVTLSWKPPPASCDGTPLTDFAKYRIVYGTSASALSRTIDVPVSVNKHVVVDLSPGTWFFGVKALDSAGADCGLSPIASKTIP